MKQKKFIIILLTFTLTATTLIGCSSASAPAKEAKETVTNAVAVKEEKVEVAEIKETDLTPRPTPKPTPEPTPEAIVYEGIDMESTLPGKEWMESFEGIIPEPKIVIFNDETNKKIIVENEQEIVIEEGDIISVYRPNFETITSVSGLNVDSGGSNNNCTVFILKTQVSKKTEFSIEFDTGELITCIVIP